MDAFSQPKMSYDAHSKAFSFSFDSKRPMNPPASGRCVCCVCGVVSHCRRHKHPDTTLEPHITHPHY